MTFNDDARIDTSRASKRSGGRKGGIAIGGGLGAVALVLLGQLLGVDLSGLTGGGGGSSASETTESLERCADASLANTDIECRMVGTADSLDDFWATTYPELTQAEYRPSHVTLFEDAVGTGCGNATSAVGPFYCPADEGIYLDVAFFEDLRTRLGADGGAFAQMYVVAHEWGHHVSNLTGAMAAADRSGSGPTSDAVRLELQADCYAGAWAGAASTTTDDRGVTLIEPPTDAQIADALDAAAAVGDDRIQEAATGQVSPESWTHGSAEQRQRWFTAGYEGGAAACTTFEVAATDL